MTTLPGPRGPTPDELDRARRYKLRQLRREISDLTRGQWWSRNWLWVAVGAALALAFGLLGVLGLVMSRIDTVI